MGSMESADTQNAVDHYQAFDGLQGAHWKPSPQLSRQGRGRQAKNPNAVTVRIDVSNLRDCEERLREYLSNPPENPEHVECQLSFWTGASFTVNAPEAPNHSSQPPQTLTAHSTAAIPPQHAPPGYQLAADGLSQSYHVASEAPAPGSVPYSDPVSAGPISSAPKKHTERISMSVLEALAPTEDPKEKMRKQRAIAKECVDAVQKADGFRYSFHNCWNSREDDSFRFSYYCNDSLLNKDRAANGKGNKLGKRATKPVFDCKGVLSVKFSAIKQTLDLFYKHVPIHKTHAERAPKPRKSSKKRKSVHEDDPDAPGLRRSTSQPIAANDGSKPLPKSRAVRRKKDGSKGPQSSIESDLRNQSLRSLLELIQTDNEPAPAPMPAPSHNVSADLAPVQPVQKQARRRSGPACEGCKARKTKCDGKRPTCGSCVDKRHCVYADASVPDSAPLSAAQLPPTEVVRQAQAASDELSELEQMKTELEATRARMQQLEAQIAQASSTPFQTAQVAPTHADVPLQVQHPAHIQQRQAPVQGQPRQSQSHPPSGASQHVQNAQQMHQTSHSHSPHLQDTHMQGAPVGPTNHSMVAAPGHAPNGQQLAAPEPPSTPAYTQFNGAVNHAAYGMGNPMEYKMASTPQSQSETPIQQTPSTGLSSTPDPGYNWAHLYPPYPTSRQDWRMFPCP
ncbi:hypothetical protein M011DRAFT_472624 [Sporormia fimetaria CBS 119925]|uniref:Zn(2)-C6 fungal-type domain-containing protein n=1 Tax=Sporormia fimetaria CBS 119925 TaxID=1340428 RepID=A0A6A6UUI8_9PLEO|nr:hypothetical protein M011DRAFT_472624 [Sporormia fimetaria CBS 119925]